MCASPECFNYNDPVVCLETCFCDSTSFFLGGGCLFWFYLTELLRDRDRDSNVLVHSQMATMARDDSVWDLKPLLGCKGLHPLLLSQAMNREMDWKWSSQDMNQHPYVILTLQVEAWHTTTWYQFPVLFFCLQLLYLLGVYSVFILTLAFSRS